MARAEGICIGMQGLRNKTFGSKGCSLIDYRNALQHQCGFAFWGVILLPPNLIL